MGIGLLQQVRGTCKEVVKRARYVHIDTDRIQAYAASLPVEYARSPKLDPQYHYSGYQDDVVAYILTLDAVNFGSGYFPYIRKRVGLSGYFTIALALKERFETKGPFTAHELTCLSAQDCAGLFGQDLDDGPRRELMGLFASALNDLGRYLLDRFAGQFVKLVKAAGSTAESLVGILAEMRHFQDIALYDGFDVLFYKRAQITVADLSMAFEGEGPGLFHDLGDLTIFADNAVPHVLRVDGIIHYEDSLASRIDTGELIPAGSAEEVEIRAAAVHAAELIVEKLGSMGQDLMSMNLDYLLWNRAQQPQYKMRPPHRTRTVFY